jgi:hypothetical protein
MLLDAKKIAGATAHSAITQEGGRAAGEIELSGKQAIHVGSLDASRRGNKRGKAVDSGGLSL